MISNVTNKTHTWCTIARFLNHFLEMQSVTGHCTSCSLVGRKYGLISRLRRFLIRWAPVPGCGAAELLDGVDCEGAEGALGRIRKDGLMSDLYVYHSMWYSCNKSSPSLCRRCWRWPSSSLYSVCRLQDSTHRRIFEYLGMTVPPWKLGEYIYSCKIHTRMGLTDSKAAMQPAFSFSASTTVNITWLRVSELGFFRGASIVQKSPWILK